MNVTSTKTTKTSTSVSWTRKVRTDDDVLVATMTGYMDYTRPLGTYKLVVSSQSAYAENEAETAELYEAFKDEFNAAIEGMEASTTLTETDGEEEEESAEAEDEEAIE